MIAYEELAYKLIQKQKEYIVYLGNNVRQNAVFLSIHGQTPTVEELEIGRQLRKEITKLEKELKPILEA